MFRYKSYVVTFCAFCGTKYFYNYDFTSVSERISTTLIREIESLSANASGRGAVAKGSSPRGASVEISTQIEKKQAAASSKARGAGVSSLNATDQDSGAGTGSAQVSEYQSTRMDRGAGSSKGLMKKERKTHELEKRATFEATSHKQTATRTTDSGSGAKSLEEKGAATATRRASSQSGGASAKGHSPRATVEISTRMEKKRASSGAGVSSPNAIDQGSSRGQMLKERQTHRLEKRATYEATSHKQTATGAADSGSEARSLAKEDSEMGAATATGRASTQSSGALAKSRSPREATVGISTGMEKKRSASGAGVSSLNATDQGSGAGTGSAQVSEYQSTRMDRGAGSSKGLTKKERRTHELEKRATFEATSHKQTATVAADSGSDAKSVEEMGTAATTDGTSNQSGGAVAKGHSPRATVEISTRMEKKQAPSGAGVSSLNATGQGSGTGAGAGAGSAQVSEYQSTRMDRGAGSSKGQMKKEKKISELEKRATFEATSHKQTATRAADSGSGAKSSEETGAAAATDGASNQSGGAVAKGHSPRATVEISTRMEKKRASSGAGVSSPNAIDQGSSRGQMLKERQTHRLEKRATYEATSHKQTATGAADSGSEARSLAKEDSEMGAATATGKASRQSGGAVAKGRRRSKYRYTTTTTTLTAERQRQEERRQREAAAEAADDERKRRKRREGSATASETTSLGVSQQNSGQTTTTMASERQRQEERRQREAAVEAADEERKRRKRRDASATASETTSLGVSQQNSGQTTTTLATERQRQEERHQREIAVEAADDERKRRKRREGSATASETTSIGASQQKSGPGQGQISDSVSMNISTTKSAPGGPKPTYEEYEKKKKKDY